VAVQGAIHAASVEAALEQRQEFLEGDYSWLCLHLLRHGRGASFLRHQLLSDRVDTR